jgi:2-polyprenyl-3-methyl-5-hydroxy-6-metoxy-1,4-benzoquinol methylase
LGGNKLTLLGVKKLINESLKIQEITIVDIGCGNGDMLRALAEYGLQNNIKFNLIGIDANNFTIEHAKNLSLQYDTIKYQCEDIFEQSFKELKYDIAICTLTLHHFKEQEIMSIMASFYENARLGIVINDLHRSKVAYRLFQGLCFVFN